MEHIKKIYEVDALDNCPNCGKTIYRGRLNSRWAMIFYYRTKHDSLRDKKGKPVIIEEIVRIGTPMAGRFKEAKICRTCLLLFFKATRFEPLGRGFEDRWEINKSQLQENLKRESKKPLTFNACPKCGGKLDRGVIIDNPPGGFMPATSFSIQLDKKIGNVKEERIIIAEDFLGHFFEAYFCHECFTAVGRMEKFHPFDMTYWDRFERPSKKVAIALDKRIKEMPSEETKIQEDLIKTSDNDNKDIPDDKELDEILSENTDEELDLELDDEEIDIDDINYDEIDIKDYMTEARLHYEYFPSVISFLDPPKKYQFCPLCGVENSEDHEKCRHCSAILPKIK